MLENNNLNYGNDVFDPTSSANLTAMGIILAGLCSLIPSSYIFGKFHTDKARSEYQASMLCFVSGFMLVFFGLFIAYQYD